MKTRIRKAKAFTRLGKWAVYSVGILISVLSTNALAQAPSILTQPQSQAIDIGSNVTFSVLPTELTKLPSVGSGTLQLWLKADAGVITNGAGLVSKWQDLSSNSNNAVQSNPNLQPILAFAPGLNGRPVIRFNGIQNNVNGSYLFGPGQVNVPDAMTFFVVYNAFVATNAENWIWGIGIPDEQGANRVAEVNTQDMQFSFWSYFWTAPFVVPTNTYRIRTDRLNANLNTLNMYDATADTETNFTFSINNGLTPGAGYYLGGINTNIGQPYVGSSRNFYGDIAEVICYQGSLTDADRQAVASYLNEKYFQNDSSGTVTYQWQFDGTNIADATNATLTLTNAQSSQGGTYTVAVSNLFGGVVSSNAVLAIGSAPSISTQPQTQGVIQGSNVTFSVSAGGTSPLSYQWYFDGSALSQATDSILSLTNVQNSNSGTYSVGISSPFGSLLSSNAVLTVDVLPVIVEQPQSEIVLVGTNVTLSVTVAGSASLPAISSGSLQLWLKADAGVTVSNGQVTQWQDQSSNTNNCAQAATNRQPSLVYDAGIGGRAAVRFNGVEDGVNGDYLQGTGNVSIPTAMTTFLFYNAFSSGDIPSVPWLVGVPGRVHGASRYDVLDSDQMIFATWTYAYYAPYDIPTNTYRIWNDRINTNLAAVEMYDISDSGSTNFIENFTEPTLMPQPGYYIGGLDNSLYGVNYQFTFQGDIAELIVYSGYLTDADRLAVVNYLQQKYYQAGVTNGVSFQWQFDGTNIAGATNATLTLADVQTNQGGSYTVIVTNLAGSVTSSNAVLDIGSAPSISTQPQSQEVIQGTNVAFLVNASGTGPFSYQWYFDGSALAQATNSTLFLTNVQNANDGAYSVKVTSPFGSVTSSNVILAVSGYTLGTTALLEGPGAGLDSVVLAVVPNTASWTNTANETWLHLSSANEDGSGSTNIIFSYDANSGPTRSGTLIIAGQTLTVTQAGSSYVAAGTLTTLVNYDSGVNGVAVDSAGNVYFSAYYANTLSKWTATNNTVTTLSSSLSGAEAVALDSAGNVYSANLVDSTIKVWLAASSNLVNLVSSGLNTPEGVAVDSAGNVYFSDTFNNALKEWSRTSGAVTTLASLNQPNGIAVDVAGNVYIGDYNNSAIEKWTAADNSVSTLTSNVAGLDGVAVDGAGNVYVANYFGSAMQKWTAANNTVTALISSGLYQPECVAVDEKGNTYIADTYDNALKELPSAFVDPTSKYEGTSAGTDSLPMVLPSTENLLPPFAPSSDSAWLTITGITNDVVSFSFAAGGPRQGHITLLGQSISVYQGITPPSASVSPSNQVADAGSNVTFTASAAGTGSLTFQWLFDGTNIAGATNSSLTLTNVLAVNSGSYTITVTSPYGSATSAAALLTVEETAVYLVVINAITTNSSPNSDTIVIPVELNALGTEAAFGFTLNFNPNLLTFQSVTLGSGASGAALILNTNQAASGVLGLGVDLFSGTFTAGTNDVFDVTFQIATVTNWATNTFTFSSEPITQQVSDAGANPLPVVWQSGALVLSPSELEGDVSPRPNGNEVVTISDWVQEARFVVGLDIVSNGLEFQRADSAPRDTLGDGEITVADWVQVGRYAAGLDPITAVGGPSSPMGSDIVHNPVKLGGSRLVSLTPVTQGALTNTLAVQLTAQGDESALGFTVTFDPALMRFVNATLGSGAAGASLAPNTAGASNGVLGFVVGYYPPNTFAAGTETVLNLNFASVTYTNTSALAFVNAPVICQLADTNATPVSTIFQNGTLTVAGSPWPLLSIGQSGSNLTLSWPASGTGALGLQVASSIAGPWTDVTGTPSTNGATLNITTSVSNSSQFFRLKY